MSQVQTIPARRAAQLHMLAKMRGWNCVSLEDSQMISQLWNHDCEVYGPLTDKDFEMIQTLADRYLIEVAT